MAIFEPVESSGPRRRLRLRSPIDLEPIGEIECQTEEDVAAALERARKAQPSWAALSFRERARYMDRVLELLIEKQDEIIDTVIRETGKARGEAIGMEILSSCDSLAYYAKNAEKFLKPEKRKIHGLIGLAKRLKVVYRPLGVVGIITPWNGPVSWR